eukprot:XP_011673621.1 PREDICTED: uncharacterized protein LOC105442758 isoform X3 [Strongylocentrotus purpuratus]
MRRARKCSRDSSQDSPVTDNERDIIWGDSPPPRRICLSTTPGRRVTRATAAEQDLTDLIECMHPKENKESSTPPLLGLWMRNRQEPDSGQKRRRPARLARRTTGRKLSRIGLDKTVLDDLRILTEWTDNLAATVEEPCSHPQKGNAEAKTEGTTELEGGQAMDCDNLEDLFDDDDDVANNVDCNKMETRQVMKEKRKSSNFSFSDDLWDSDDWCDDDSIIRIATQVENEALTKQMQQVKGRIESLNSNADVISRTQNGNVVNAKSKMCLSYDQSKTSVCNGVNLQSKNAGLSVQTTSSGRMDSGQSMTRGASKGVSRPTWTTQSSAQVPVSRNTSKGSQMPAQKPATMSYRKGPVHTSTSHAPSLNSKAVSTAPIPSTSTHQSAKSVSNVKPPCTKYSVYTNANMNVSRRTVQKAPVKSSCAPTKCIPPATYSANSALQVGHGHTTCTRLSEKTARVPPMTDAIHAAPVKGQGFNDSLDDLFAGDNSLPDDMLLALLDNDSDFEEITKEAPSTVPVGSDDSTQKQLLGDFTGNIVGNSCKPTVTKTPTHSMSTRAQYSSEGTSKSKGSDSCTTSKYGSRSSTPKNQNQSTITQAVGTARSRFTRSTAQSPVTKQSINHQAVTLDRKNVGVEPGHGRRSLSQPVPPAVKEGGVPMQRGCSQQEIEQKRQAALAKRKKSKFRVSPTA